MSIKRPCVYWNDGYCKKFSNNEVTSWCVDGGRMREKLIELVKKKYDHYIENLADYLIANGVRINEWIPVTERLPEFYMNEDGCYCTHGKLVFRSDWDKTVHIGYCIKLTYIINVDTLETIETLEWYDDNGRMWDNITHWILLPPKGD